MSLSDKVTDRKKESGKGKLIIGDHLSIVSQKNLLVVTLVVPYNPHRMLRTSHNLFGA